MHHILTREVCLKIKYAARAILRGFNKQFGRGVVKVCQWLGVMDPSS